MFIFMRGSLFSFTMRQTSSIPSHCALYSVMHEKAGTLARSHTFPPSWRLFHSYTPSRRPRILTVLMKPAVISIITALFHPRSPSQCRHIPVRHHPSSLLSSRDTSLMKFSSSASSTSRYLPFVSSPLNTCSACVSAPPNC